MWSAWEVRWAGDSRAFPTRPLRDLESPPGVPTLSFQPTSQGAQVPAWVPRAPLASPQVPQHCVPHEAGLATQDGTSLEGAGWRCSPRGLGEVLVCNIQTSLMLTFLWTKAFTLETLSVFLPIIMITEHVIPLLLFFLPSFDLSSRSCFLCSPGCCAPPSPGYLWETHVCTHGLYCRPSPKVRGKKKKVKTRSKSHKCSRCQVVPQDLYLTPSSGFAGLWQEINQKEKQSFSKTLLCFIINQGSVYISQCLAELQETFNEARTGLKPWLWTYLLLIGVVYDFM